MTKRSIFLWFIKYFAWWSTLINKRPIVPSHSTWILIHWYEVTQISIYNLSTDHNTKFKQNHLMNSFLCINSMHSVQWRYKNGTVHVHLKDNFLSYHKDTQLPWSWKKSFSHFKWVVVISNLISKYYIPMSKHQLLSGYWKILIVKVLRGFSFLSFIKTHDECEAEVMCRSHSCCVYRVANGDQQGYT